MEGATKSLSPEAKENSESKEKDNADTGKKISQKLSSDTIKTKENESPVGQNKNEKIDLNSGEQGDVPPSDSTTHASKPSVPNGDEKQISKMEIGNLAPKQTTSTITKGKSLSRFKMTASKVIKIHRIQNLMAGITLNVDKSSTAEKESNLERKALLASISQLSYHVPECVVIDLSSSIEKTVNDQIKCIQNTVETEQNKKNENKNEHSEPDKIAQSKKVEDPTFQQHKKKEYKNGFSESDKPTQSKKIEDPSFQQHKEKEYQNGISDSNKATKSSKIEDSTPTQLRKNKNRITVPSTKKKPLDIEGSQLRENEYKIVNVEPKKTMTNATFKKKPLNETNILGLSRENSSRMSLKSNNEGVTMENIQMRMGESFVRRQNFRHTLPTVIDASNESLFSNKTDRHTRNEFDSYAAFMSVDSIGLSDDENPTRTLKQSKKKNKNKILTFKNTRDWDSFKTSSIPGTYETSKKKSLFRKMKSKLFKRKKKRSNQVENEVSQSITPMSSFAVPLDLEPSDDNIYSTQHTSIKENPISSRKDQGKTGKPNMTNEQSPVSPISSNTDQSEDSTELSNHGRIGGLDLKQFSRPTLLRNTSVYNHSAISMDAKSTRFLSKKRYSLRRNSNHDEDIQDKSWKSIEKLLESHNDENGLKKRGESLSSIRRQSSKGLPLVVSRKAALLFVDISGFTRLSTLVTVETLSSSINSYFEMITDEINLFGGDVLKFAGDAVFAEWRAAANPLIAKKNKTLEGCVALASKCGAKIVARCADFPIYASAEDKERNKPISTLNVHCGIGAGELTGVHVGNCTSNREFLILGDPIDQVAEAESIAQLGELVASPKVMKILTNVFKISGEIQSSLPTRPQILATPSNTYFEWNDEPILDRNFSSELNSSPTKKLHELCCFLDIQGLRDFRKLISLYVHKVVINEVDQELHKRTPTPLIERINAEAELRPVYVMFINILRINSRLPITSNDQERLTELLNDIFLVVVRELERYNGHLRQFIVDDKGVVLIATFGLRGSTSQNMITRRALPATKRIQKELLSELNVVTHIGATMGDAYCGIVGGVQRHEYAVMGPSVNLAARLMASEANPGILVDNKVRLEAGSSFVFNALGSVAAKGYAEPVQIFEPVGLSERKWKKVDPQFAERDEELKKILSTGKDILLHDNQPSFFLICGEELSGKSSLLAKSAECLRIIASHCDRPTIFLRYVNNDTDSEVPLGTFKFIFREFLDQLRWENYLFKTDLKKSNPESSFNFFKLICDKIDVPNEVIDFVQKSYYETKENNSLQNSEHDADWNLVTKHLARIIVYCSNHENMLMIALDDVQNMDEYSWRLLEAIFELGSNLMIICASLPSNTSKKTFKHSFWTSLEGETYDNKSRYELLNLKPLSKEFSRTLCKIKLDELPIDEELMNSIVQESKGIPGKLIKMVEEVQQIKKGRNTERLTIIKDELKSGQIADIFMYQLDSLDPSVRKTLQVCAVLGDKFTLYELVAITEQWLRNKDENVRLDHARSIHEQINTAVMEMILDEIIQDELSEKENGVKIGEMQHPYGNLNQSYRFCHHAWRQNILSLMLESQKDELQNKISSAWKTIRRKNK